MLKKIPTYLISLIPLSLIAGPFIAEFILLILSIYFIFKIKKHEIFLFKNKFFIGFIILAAAEISVRYSGTSWNHALLYYIMPIGMIPFFYLLLIRKFKYENLR